MQHNDLFKRLEQYKIENDLFMKKSELAKSTLNLLVDVVSDLSFWDKKIDFNTIKSINAILASKESPYGRLRDVKFCAAQALALSTQRQVSGKKCLHNEVKRLLKMIVNDNYADLDKLKLEMRRQRGQQLACAKDEKEENKTFNDNYFNFSL